MSKQFARFLQTLGEDPNTLEQYKEDPDRIMKEAGLTQDDRQSMLSGDPKKIRQALAGGEEAAGVQAQAETAIVIVVA